MKKKILYQPVVYQKGSDYFTVEGAISDDRDQAISRTKKHVAFRDPETKIVRVDEIEVEDNE